MSTGPVNDVVEHLRKTVLRQDESSPDDQLLRHFIVRRDGSAFSAIFSRHTQMVFGVCRRVLRNQQDAEDAFQAVFLVLARKASSIAKRELLANWIYGVGFNIARRPRRWPPSGRAERSRSSTCRSPRSPTADRVNENKKRINRPAAGQS
jgi:hypothetical protein